uniref:Uncharacterized protein n=1 Tax=Nelumbo nucifera TaxID=4432 RepID=A0A822ZG64_NELNU|nr:TPA_asm: hypothetical protein HUJ06_000266 [Nelumbo nucifera]
MENHHGGETGSGRVVKRMSLQNPIDRAAADALQGLWKLDSGLWLSKQSLPVVAAVVTATSAAIVTFMGTLTNDVFSSFLTPSPQPMASLKQARVGGFQYPTSYLSFLKILSQGL